KLHQKIFGIGLLTAVIVPHLYEKGYKTLKHYCQKKLSSLQVKARSEFKSCDVSSGKPLKSKV
ncbi:hypothetical protein QUA71_28810, partial [Microcoleus sp. MON1_C5]|uniref:hypothetical protein n=1 Tax=Microcoleus sp. MON1_C5 TaxID=2818828 RepID=UPI002FD6F688